MTPTTPPTPRPPGSASANILIRILDSQRRTDNLLRLLRWLIPATVLITAIASTTLAVIALGSPTTITGLAGGASTATVGSLLWRAHRARTPHNNDGGCPAQADTDTAADQSPHEKTRPTKGSGGVCIYYTWW